MVGRFFIITLLWVLLLSCNDRKASTVLSLQTAVDIRPPKINAAGKPIMVDVDTCPKAQTITIPVRDSSYFNFKTANGERRQKLVPPTVRPADFFIPMKNYTAEDGLAIDAIISGYTDKRGSLWFGTHGGGITRFDGKFSMSLTADEGLGNNAIDNTIEDREGNLWFSLQGGGLACYDGYSIRLYNKTNGLISDEVRSAVFDKDDNILIATREGPCLFNRRQFRSLKNVDGFAGTDVLTMVQDNQGHTWFGMREAGLNFYDGKKFTNFSTGQGLSDIDIISSYRDRKGNLWFGTRNSSIMKFDGKTFTTYKGLAGQPVQSIHCINEDREGNLWFGSYNNGIACYNGQTFTSITKKQGLSDNIVYTIINDRTGNLWFGTYGGGVSCYKGKAFSFLTTAQGLPDNIVRNIIEDSNGNYWFGLNTNGVCKYDGRTITNFFREQGFMDNKCNRVFEDKEHYLWFCTGHGVYKFDGKRLTNFSNLQGLANNAVRCIIQDKKHNMWFGTEVGLSKFDGRFFYNFTRDQGLPSNNIRDMVEDDNGVIWLGTTGGGLVRYDGKNFRILDTSHGLCNNFINNLTIDSRGNLWICTGDGGLSILRKEVIKKLESGGSDQELKNYFENFTTNEGLSDNVVYDAVEDHKGNIILGTNLGITLVKGGLDRQKPIAKAQLEYYNWKNGNYIKDVNTQALYVDRKGIIWIGTSDKLVQFNYTALKKDSSPPVVKIQSLKVNNETIGWYNLLNHTNTTWISKIHDIRSAIKIEEKMLYKRTLAQSERDSIQSEFGDIVFDSITRFYPLPVNLVLPYSHNNVTFEFGAIEPARPELVRYQYMLEGYDKNWNPVTDKSSANFGNIHEGEYIFKVKAISPEGVWSEPILYTFTVLPPYYRSWWFRLIETSAAVILILFVIKIRITAVRKAEQKKLTHEKELLEMEARALRAQMNPHFIFNCLNSIKALMMQHETERGIAYLTTFSKLIRTLFHNSDKRQISLYDEIETCKLYTQLESMRLEGKLSYAFNIDPNVDLKSVMVPALIIQPFIENAIWHGIIPNGQGIVTISIQGKADTIICEVDDNGIGREKSKLNKPITPVIHESNGVYLAQKRLKLERTINDSNASVEIVDKYESNEARGTKVILTFNLN